MIQKIKQYGVLVASIVAGASALVINSASAQTLFTMPDATTALSSTAAYSAPTFTAFLPVSWIILGFAIGAMVVGVVIRAIMGGAKRVLMRRGGGRGRRRR